MLLKVIENTDDQLNWKHSTSGTVVAFAIDDAYTQLSQYIHTPPTAHRIETEKAACSNHIDFNIFVIFIITKHEEISM